MGEGVSWVDELVSRSPMRNKIGFKGELEFMGATESDQGGRTVTFRIVRRPEEIGSAHPFSLFTRRKGKRAGSIFEAAVVNIATESTYTDELMLLGWADGPQGATVRMGVGCNDDRHPFLGYTRPSKGTAGTRFMAVLVEKMDDEQIVDQEKAERFESSIAQGKRPQRLSNAVAIILKTPRFHDWLREKVEARDWDEKSADTWLKTTLKIESKSELDGKNEDAVVGWNRIRLRYVAWQEEHGFIDPRHMES